MGQEKEQQSILSDVTVMKSLFWGEVVKLIPEKWWKKTFEGLDFSGVNGEVIKKASEMVQKWDFQEPLTLAIVSNCTGIGKSHMLFCLFKKYIWNFFQDNIKENYESYLSGGHNYNLPNVKIVSEIDLLAEVQETYDNASLFSESQVMQEYYKYEFLCIDGALDDRAKKDKAKNDFSSRILYEILEKRSNWKCKPTAITSNMSLADICTVDPKIASRINNSAIVNIGSEVPDYRERE